MVYLHHGLVLHTTWYGLASSPGHSHVFNVACIKNWEGLGTRLGMDSLGHENNLEVLLTHSVNHTLLGLSTNAVYLWLAPTSLALLLIVQNKSSVPDPLFLLRVWHPDYPL